MNSIAPVPAFNDNYIWLIHDSASLEQARHAAVVDPGDAAPVLRTLRDHALQLTAILITHHHSDHIGGIAALSAAYDAPVYGPAGEKINGLTHKLRDGDHIELDHGLGKYDVIDVPGHTSGHIAYFGGNTLFCGDTLFAGGCGRLFEGTAQQMFASLNKLRSLPTTTRVYCGHEYTLGNLRFAHQVEPQNAVLAQRLKDTEAARDAGRPTLPSTLEVEKQTNPFLRWDQPAVQRAAATWAGRELPEPWQVFSAMRQWKDASS